MSRPANPLVIDARPRGPRGLLAGELVQGRSVLGRLVDLADSLDAGSTIVVHARQEEHVRLRELLGESVAARMAFATGPPSESATILRTDRLYDASRLRRAVKKGKDPETAVIWRLDQPHGLVGAEAELTRRLTYQPLGRFWALAPARLLARRLSPTRVRPNHLTLAATGLMLVAATLVATLGPRLWGQLTIAMALALALVLDTADGHLARLQGTASELGRWLDASLDELSDMVLHGAIAWGAYLRDGHPGWLVLGMTYGMGKYLFFVVAESGKALETASTLPASPPHTATRSAGKLTNRRQSVGPLKTLVRLAGHADLRWHLWIVLAAMGRLDVALALYAFYFPVRALASGVGKVVTLG